MALAPSVSETTARESFASHRPFLGQLAGFIRAHLFHAVLIIPGALVLTLLHESAHALAVILQGGSVTEFQWIPSAQSWGHMAFTFPRAIQYSSSFVSLAPHFLSLAMVLAATFVTLNKPKRSDRTAAAIYFWLFFVPAADIGLALLIWLLGGNNDLADAFGSPTVSRCVCVIAFAVGIFLLGYAIQSRLYDRLRLRWPAYTALVALALFLMSGFLGAAFHFAPK